MAKSEIRLPPEINGRVRIQHVDASTLTYLCWRGFFPERFELGGRCTLRRDFHDGTFAHYPEPPPPRFEVIPVA
jgi:hypothetical protein